jgi:hypothetical protein
VVNASQANGSIHGRGDSMRPSKVEMIFSPPVPMPLCSHPLTTRWLKRGTAMAVPRLSPESKNGPPSREGGPIHE